MIIFTSRNCDLVTLDIKCAHLMNCSMRSETNLAVVTMNDPGSLNVWALCSM